MTSTPNSWAWRYYRRERREERGERREERGERREEGKYQSRYHMARSERPGSLSSCQLQWEEGVYYIIIAIAAIKEDVIRLENDAVVSAKRKSVVFGKRNQHHPPNASNSRRRRQRREPFWRQSATRATHAAASQSQHGPNANNNNNNRAQEAIQFAGLCSTLYRLPQSIDFDIDGYSDSIIAVAQICTQTAWLEQHLLTLL